MRVQRYLIADELGRPLRAVVTYGELVEANEDDTMEIIEEMEIGDHLILGMMDAIERIADLVEAV